MTGHPQRLHRQSTRAGIARDALASILTLTAIILAGAGQARADVPHRFEAVTTPRGLTFYYREQPSTPFAAINFGMRDIWGFTTPGKEGFNALAPTLVMQGTDADGHAELLERLKDLTATASITFGSFSTNASVRAPTATVAQSTMLLASAIRTAQPSARLMERLKQRATGADAQAAATAETMAERAALWFALGDHPVTRALDPGRFARLEADDLDAWRQAALDRSRLRLAVSGRIRREDAIRIIDEAFADLPSIGPLPRRDWPDIELHGGTVVIEHDTPQSAVMLVGLTSLGPSSEVETAQAAASVLGGTNGRLWQGVRANLGSTYGARASMMLAGPGKRLIVLRAAVANDLVKPSIGALKSVYTRWRDHGVSASELAAATSRMITDYRGQMDDPARANALVIGMQLAGRPVDDLTTFDRRIGGIKREALNQFILEKFPAADRLVTVIVTPRAAGLGATCVVRTPEESMGCPKH